MAIMSGGCPSLVMVIASGAPRPDVMTIAQAARGAIIQPARLHTRLRRELSRSVKPGSPFPLQGTLSALHGSNFHLVIGVGRWIRGMAQLVGKRDDYGYGSLVPRS